MLYGANLYQKKKKSTCYFLLSENFFLISYGTVSGSHKPSIELLSTFRRSLIEKHGQEYKKRNKKKKEKFIQKPHKRYAPFWPQPLKMRKGAPLANYSAIFDSKLNNNSSLNIGTPLVQTKGASFHTHAILWSLLTCSKSRKVVYFFPLNFFYWKNLAKYIKSHIFVIFQYN